MTTSKTLADRCVTCGRGVYVVDTEDDPIPGSWCSFCNAPEPIYIDPGSGGPVEERYAHLDLSGLTIKKSPPREAVTSTDRGGRPRKSLTAKQKAKREYQREYMRRKRSG